MKGYKMKKLQLVLLSFALFFVACEQDSEGLMENSQNQSSTEEGNYEEENNEVVGKISSEKEDVETTNNNQGDGQNKGEKSKVVNDLEVHYIDANQADAT